MAGAMKRKIHTSHKQEGLSCQQTELKGWKYQLDRKLMMNCAYYPQQGCHLCKFEWPLPSCKRAHIIIDTQLNPPQNWKPTVRQVRDEFSFIHLTPKQKREGRVVRKEETLFGRKLSEMSPELMGEIMRLLKEVEG